MINNMKSKRKMDVLTAIQQRYTSKAYDPTRSIPTAQFERLIQLLRLTPSSINIQPWQFMVADHAHAKQRIAKALVDKYAYNAPKVLASSHSIVFCSKTDIDEQHLDRILQQEIQDGRFRDLKAQQGQQQSRQGYVDFYRQEKGDISRWTENQTFIALGQLLLAASFEGIDATPIGGFNEQILSQELNLTAQGLKPSVIVALGYHHDDDFNATLPKSRLDEQLIMTRIE
ncbi:nitroreductase/dihydropteridine reductase [Acinetobacter calcoaceticus]|uniref:Nitroreductase/dihydropteridine reductase n=1 Tax=Acinetobacter calcoaceticus TaxID=471 RepID=A0A4R1XWQ0_ACICA|nr:nitroreductase/dihydropteridine reductase [Acinetobacter calcoaceticus]